eukprot:SAG22_NODE_1568_length_4098_cov_21.457614_2_plen_638_part_00
MYSSAPIVAVIDMPSSPKRIPTGTVLVAPASRPVFDGVHTALNALTRAAGGADFTNEVALFQRVLFVNKTQHRKTVYIRKLVEASRGLNALLALPLLGLAGQFEALIGEQLETKLPAAPALHGARPPPSEIELPCASVRAVPFFPSLRDLFCCCRPAAARPICCADRSESQSAPQAADELLMAARVSAAVAATVEAALIVCARAMRGMLVQSNFMPFALTMLATVSRLHMLLGRISEAREVAGGACQRCRSFLPKVAGARRPVEADSDESGLSVEEDEDRARNLVNLRGVQENDLSQENQEDRRPQAETAGEQTLAAGGEECGADTRAALPEVENEMVVEQSSAIDAADNEAGGTDGVNPGDSDEGAAAAADVDDDDDDDNANGDDSSEHEDESSDCSGDESDTETDTAVGGTGAEGTEAAGAGGKLVSVKAERNRLWQAARAAAASARQADGGSAAASGTDGGGAADRRPARLDRDAGVGAEAAAAQQQKRRRSLSRAGSNRAGFLNNQHLRLECIAVNGAVAYGRTARARFAGFSVLAANGRTDLVASRAGGRQQGQQPGAARPHQPRDGAPKKRKRARRRVIVCETAAALANPSFGGGGDPAENTDGWPVPRKGKKKRAADAAAVNNQLLALMS